MAPVRSGHESTRASEYSFGNWVRRRRKSLDLTRQELARKVGCSVSAIIKIESDERRPSLQIAGLLAAQLEIPAEHRPLFLKVARRERGVEALGSLPPASIPIPFPGQSISRESADVLRRQAAALPAPLMPIIGREHELGAIIQQLQDPSCRLLTLTGPGGAGKTRLALEAAHLLQEELGQDVYFVPLAGTKAPEFIVPAIADAAGLTFQTTGDPEQQLLRFLREKQTVLALDNLEHLLGGIEVLAALLEGAPELKILATSREALGLRSEWAFAVQGLPIPAGTDVESLEGNSAAALFLRRSRQSLHGFRLKPEDVPALERICELVEGLPLALELAATWVRTLSCAEIAREIERSLDFLAVEARDLPERHQSMRAVFDSSWSLLTDEERNTMCRLAVFRGGWTREAGEWVAGATLSVLSSLVDKSLVRHSEAQAGRYSLHDLIQQYAREQFHQFSEFGIACNRHLEFFLELVESTERRLRGPEEVLWLDRLEMELDNLRAALEWSLNQEDPALSLRLAAGLYTFWKRKNHWSEGRDWLRRALEHSAARSATLDRAAALNAAALLAVEQSDTGEARRLAEENLGLAHELDNSPAIGRALHSMGLVLWKEKRHNEARAHSEQALGLFRELGDGFSAAESLHSLGHIAINQDDLQAAQAYLEEALAAFQASALGLGLTDVRGDLGLVAYLRRDYTAAQSYLNDSLERFREAGNLAGIESALNRLGDVARAQGDYDRAGQLYEESAALFRDMGDRDETASLLHNLGCVALMHQEHARALGLFREGLGLQHEMGNQAGIAECLVGVASVLVAEDSVERGARLLGAAEALREATGAVLWPANQIEYDRLLGRVQDRLEPAVMKEAWNTGRRMPAEQAVAEACG